MTSTYEIRYFFRVRVTSSTAYLTSVRTHCRASSALRLGILIRKHYSTTSTYECRYTLHERIMPVVPSLASKEHSQEQSVIFPQDHPQERILSSTSECRTFSSSSGILGLFHTVASPSFGINDSLIITPHFLGGSISST